MAIDATFHLLCDCTESFSGLWPALPLFFVLIFTLGRPLSCPILPPCSLAATALSEYAI